ncbi:MAG: hypothetical protein AB7S77_21075, partial [Desulfatirhabdiaceae bacterium]
MPIPKRPDATKPRRLILAKIFITLPVCIRNTVSGEPSRVHRDMIDRRSDEIYIHPGIQVSLPSKPYELWLYHVVCSITIGAFANITMQSDMAW